MKLNSAQPGDFAEVPMNSDGQIGATGTIRTFEIIAVAKDAYDDHYVLVDYKKELLYNSVNLSLSQVKLTVDEFLIEQIVKLKSDIYRYQGNQVRWLNSNRVVKLVAPPVRERGGCNCKICKEFYDYAEPNQPDGITLICYSCRQNPMRAYY